MSYFAPSSASASLPAGTIVAFAGSTAPAGWFICDGSLKDRTTYAALFSAIGTAYGIGDGSTTFGLPDFRGRMPMGKSASGTGAILGESGGSTTHGHTGGGSSTSASGSTGSSSHSHSVPDTNSTGAHNHTAHNTSSNTSTGGSATRVTAGGHSVDGGHTHTVGTTDSSSHSHSVSFSFTPSVTINNSSATYPPFQSVNFIIKS